MKVTALEEYGLRCMILLARQEDSNDNLSLTDISEKEALSVPYAGKLMMILRKGGLVKAERGRLGGYSLSKPAGEIYLKDIFEVLGEPLFGSTHCDRHAGGKENCIHKDDCTVQHIWNSFDRFIGDILDTITLADLAGGRKKLLESLRSSIS